MDATIGVAAQSATATNDTALSAATPAVEAPKYRSISELKLPALRLYLRAADVRSHQDRYGYRACREGADWLDRQIAAQGRKKSWKLDWPTLLSILASRDYLAREYICWAMDCGLIPRLNFARSNLERANLRSANLDGANLRSANLVGANLDGANLVGANLVGANLVGANLVGADLRYANLVGANLDGANLGGANLRSANLGGANLRSANLDGANLVGANLDGANLGGCSRWSHDAAIPGWELRNGVLVRAGS